MDHVDFDENQIKIFFCKRIPFKNIVCVVAAILCVTSVNIGIEKDEAGYAECVTSVASIASTCLSGECHNILWHVRVSPLSSHSCYLGHRILNPLITRWGYNSPIGLQMNVTWHCGCWTLVLNEHDYHPPPWWLNARPVLGLAPSQWETALLCNDVSHWRGANLESALCFR